MLIYFGKISRSCIRRYRPHQRWHCGEVCSTLSQIIRFNASVEHWLVEPVLDLEKEHRERYMQLANTSCIAQYPIKITYGMLACTMNNELNERTGEACHQEKAASKVVL